MRRTALSPTRPSPISDRFVNGSCQRNRRAVVLSSAPPPTLASPSRRAVRPRRAEPRYAGQRPLSGGSDQIRPDIVLGFVSGLCPGRFELVTKALLSAASGKGVECALN
jgi:hypothetical protein